MTDAFALLGLPPRAALDESVLQDAWRQAARAAHPDQPGGDAVRAAELNAALDTLKSPVSRLKHLLELRQIPWRAVPLDAGLMQLFERLGPLLQRGATLLSQKQAAASALAKALFARQELQQREALEDLGTEIAEAWKALEQNLPALDARLSSGDTQAWTDLQACQARLAYLDKWRRQLREQLLALTLA
jgi:curved DNA-binding protein CbpA